MESSGDTYTFEDLAEGTSFTIKGKVSDTKDRYSNVFSKNDTMPEYKLPIITSVSTIPSSTSIKVNLTVKEGTAKVTEYYYSMDNGNTFVKSDSSSHSFTNLMQNSIYFIKVYVKDSNGRSSVVHSKREKTLGLFLSDYIKSKYTGTQGVNDIYYHNLTLRNSTKDYSYRYAGSNSTVKNFVCFGYTSTDGTCPTDNLYRVIGVFGARVKLIKFDYVTSDLLGTDGADRGTYRSIDRTGTWGRTYGSNSKDKVEVYYWNNDASNWSESPLNKVNLNKNFLNNIGTVWANKISMSTWKVGGNTWGKIAEQMEATAYQNEIVSPASSSTYNAKIGLMYVSDYGGASTEVRTAVTGTFVLSNYAALTSVNWMYMGLWEWTLTSDTRYFDYSFNVNYSGNIDAGKVS